MTSGERGRAAKSLRRDAGRAGFVLQLFDDRSLVERASRAAEFDEVICEKGSDQLGVSPDCWVEETLFELTEMSFDLHRCLRQLLLCVGQLLLGFEEAADAVERAGFAEDDQTFEERWGHGAAGEDGAEEHEVLLDRPGFFFA